MSLGASDYFRMDIKKEKKEIRSSGKIDLERYILSIFDCLTVGFAGLPVAGLSLLILKNDRKLYFHVPIGFLY